MNPYLMVSRAGTLRRFFLVLLLVGGLILVFGAEELPDRVELTRLQLSLALGLLLLAFLLSGLYFTTLQSQRQVSEACRHATVGRLAATVEHAPHVAVQWYDPQGRVIYWNGASEQLFGWSAQEALGKTLDQLMLTPVETQRFRTALAHLAVSESVIGPNEITIRRRDGAERVILSAMYSIPGETGPIFVCMDADLSEREAVARMEHEVRFRTLFEHAPVACVTLDQAGALVESNPAVSDLLGYRREDLPGSAFATLWQDPTQFPPVFDALQTSGASRTEVVLRHRDGRPVPVLLECRVQRDGEGRRNGIHCILFHLDTRSHRGKTLEDWLQEP